MITEVYRILSIGAGVNQNVPRKMPVPLRWLGRALFLTVDRWMGVRMWWSYQLFCLSPRIFTKKKEQKADADLYAYYLGGRNKIIIEQQNTSRYFYIVDRNDDGLNQLSLLVNAAWHDIYDRLISARNVDLSLLSCAIHDLRYLHGQKSVLRHLRRVKKMAGMFRQHSEQARKFVEQLLLLIENESRLDLQAMPDAE